MTVLSECDLTSLLKNSGDKSARNGPRPPSPAPLPRRVRVLTAGAHREADRHADEAEGLAQAVDEIALVALGDALDRIAEQDEERRARLGLRDIADLDPPPGGGRRRRRVDDRREPAV
jgi:hypothetical protein